MTPQKKIRVGAGFVAIWVLLGGAWLCDNFFGDTEFWTLASGQRHGSTHSAAAGREKTINTGQPGSVFRLVIVEAPKAPKT